MRNRVRSWVACLLVAMMLVLAGCMEGAGPKAVPPEPKPQVELTEVMVYRVPTSGTNKLEPEKVKYAAGNKALPLVALEALVNTAPTGKNLTNLFPEGTKVKGVTVKNGVAYADFNEAFGAARVAGTEDELLLVNSIVATLTELPDIQKVQILVEGKPIVTLKGGHLDLMDPLERDKTYLK